MRDHIQEEKAATSELGGFIKYNKPSCSIPRNFPQGQNLRPLGYVLKKVVEVLSEQGLEHLGRMKNG